jgi:uncharacterized SAM-binding protein YcdF (DUF218 family)
MQVKKYIAVVFFVVLSFLLVGIFFHASILKMVAQPLVRSDRIEPADAIVVLTGDISGKRMDGAIKLLKQGYGKYIVFWGGPIYWKVNYSELFLRQLKENGVNEDKAVWSDESLEEESTYGEALVNMKLLTQKRARSFILVTSDFHSARSGRVYAPLAAKQGMAMHVHSILDKEVVFDGWWKDRGSRKQVLLEWQKTIWYFFESPR